MQVGSWHGQNHVTTVLTGSGRRCSLRKGLCCGSEGNSEQAELGSWPRRMQTNGHCQFLNWSHLKLGTVSFIFFWKKKSPMH